MAVWGASIAVIFSAMIAASPVRAADTDVTVSPAPRARAATAVDTTAPLRNRSVEYGCKRIWRCDAQVCEWRRGCWGAYGYMEAPYYSVPLAQRQWQMHAWPTSSR